MKKKIEILIKSVIYLIFFVPLLVIPSSYIFPFIVPKIIYFRSLVEIMLSLYILLLVINWQEYKPKYNYLNLVVFLFLLSFAISTFTGTDTYHSFWDNHERMLGLFTLIHYIIFYIICNTVLKNMADWKWTSRVFLVGGSVVMFIGWLQTQSPNLLLNNGATRVSSTLGNPIYVGGYGLFLLFLAMLMYSREKDNLWKLFYILSGFLGFMGMFWSGNRGTMLGLVAGVAFALVGYIIVLKNYPKIRYSLLGVMLIGMVGLSLLYTFKQTNFVKNLPAIGRAVNTSLSDVEASPRWIAWQIALESWKEKPLFGWGPNNYFYAFNEHYKPKSLDFGYSETWFDNAHNIVVNTLAVQGLFGLLTYLSIFLVAIFSLAHAYRKKYVDYHFSIICSAFIVAHFIGVVTVFEDPTSYIYLMFWLALISSFAFNANKNSLPLTNENNSVFIGGEKKLSYGLVAAVGVICIFIIYVFNIQPAKANKKTLDALRSLAGDPIIGLLSVKEVLAFTSPHIDDIRSDIARTVAQDLNINWQKIGKDRSNDLLLVVIQNLEKNLVLHPLDIRNQLMLAQLYQLSAVINNNVAWMFKAESVLEDALSKSPKRQQIIFSLASIKIQINKNSDAIKLLDQALIDNSKISETYWRLAYTYKIDNQIKKAEEIIKKSKDNGIVFTEQEQNIIKQFMSTVNVNTSK